MLLPDRECPAEYDFRIFTHKYASSTLALAENMCNIMHTQNLLMHNDRIASTRAEKFKETNMAAKKTVNINTVTPDLKNQM